MKLVEFYPNKQGRPAIIPSKDMETGMAPFPQNSIPGITVQASYSTTERTENYTAGNIPVILVDAAGNSVAIALPAPSANKGKYYYIKKIDASSNVVLVESTACIDGELSISITAQYQYILVISDGSTWHIIGGMNVKLETILDDKLSEVIQLLQLLTIDTKRNNLHLASISDQSVSEEDIDDC